MGRFCPNVRTLTPPRKLNGFGKKNLKLRCSIKKLTYSFKVLRKNRRMEKTATTSFILCTRTIDTMSRVVSQTRDRGNIQRALTGKPDGDRPSGAPRRRRNDNIKNAVTQTGCEYVSRIQWALSKGHWQWSVDAGLLRDMTLCQRVSFYRRFKGIVAP